MSGTGPSVTRALEQRLTRRLLLRGTIAATMLLPLGAACAPQAPPAAQPAAPAAPAPAAPAAPKAAEAGKPAEAAKPAAKPATPPKDGGTFRFYLHTENAPTLDPHLNISFRSQEFAAFVYSRLLMSKKGPGIAGNAYILEGDLAESWKVGEDQKTYTFTLRPNAKWHNKPPLNGRPVTAQDVAWSFERFMKVSPQKTTFDQVASVTALDDRNVQFKLKDVFAPFEAAIASPILWILPREIVEADGDASKRVVGSGPFMFDKYESGVAFTAKKNPTYHRPGEPHVDEVVGIIIPDVATRLAGLRGRELDGAEVEQQDIESLQKTNPDIQIVEVEWIHIPWIAWKMDKPPFNDVRVRQAISMGVNREEFIKTTFNGRGKWNSVIPYGLSDWWLDPNGPDFGPNAKYYKFDPAEAKRLLTAAGYPNGFKVEMIATPGYGQVFMQRAEVIQAQLKAIGIDASMKTQEYSAYIGTTFRGQFESGNTIVFGLETPFTEPHDFLFNHFHPKGTRNRWDVNDPKLTEMIEKQVRTLDRAERKKQIYEIQRYAAEQMYYVPVAAGYRAMAYQGYMRDAYPRSDYGLGSEVIPKLWIDK